MRTAWLCWTVLLCAGVSWSGLNIVAQETASEPLVLAVDLDGDGRKEVISRRRLGAEREIGEFFQLWVKSADGAVLWKGPEILDPNDPLAFGEWHFGVSLPQLAADVDDDGKIELIAPAPQSDVSPTFFRVLQWTGKGFEPGHLRALTGKGRRGAPFLWTEKPVLSDWWVQQWLGESPEGGWVVELVSLPEGGELGAAIAVLVTKGDGFELLRWVQPPAKPGEFLTDTAADGGSVSYRARLSAKDHVNSAGQALRKIADILRQDRANVHRGTHRDLEDQVDVRFASKEAREALAGMPITVDGGANEEARIIRGTPLVEVQITAGAVRVSVESD